MHRKAPEGQILNFQNTFDRTCDEIRMEIQTENFFGSLISMSLWSSLHLWLFIASGLHTDIKILFSVEQITLTVATWVMGQQTFSSQHHR
jgi:hypothetical protein